MAAARDARLRKTLEELRDLWERSAQRHAIQESSADLKTKSATNVTMLVRRPSALDVWQNDGGIGQTRNCEPTAMNRSDSGKATTTLQSQRSRSARNSLRISSSTPRAWRALARAAVNSGRWPAHVVPHLEFQNLLQPNPAGDPIRQWFVPTRIPRGSKARLHASGNWRRTENRSSPVTTEHLQTRRYDAGEWVAMYAIPIDSAKHTGE
jgi:hypothetical protein